MQSSRTEDNFEDQIIRGRSAATAQKVLPETKIEILQEEEKKNSTVVSLTKCGDSVLPIRNQLKKVFGGYALFFEIGVLWN